MVRRQKEIHAFGIPMIWREPIDHVTDLYFCIVKTTGFNTKNNDAIQYQNLESAML